MPASILLNDLIDEYTESMKGRGCAASTIRWNRNACKTFLAHVGNIQIRNIEARHVDSYFSWCLSKGLSAGTCNLRLAALRSLFKHAFTRRHLVSGFDPTAHRRAMRVAAKQKRRVPASEFERLLDACTHPRDRIMVAIGIYCLQRQSEVVAHKIVDADLTHGFLATFQRKTGKFDEMPVSAELDRELRRWLTFYSEQCGELDPNWYLVPAKTPPVLNGRGAVDPMSAVLVPTRPAAKSERAIQRALVACGYDLRDADGKTTRDGVHTLRRSAARAMYESLVDDGYDGALSVVQELLHHSDSKITEAYIGSELNKKRRDDLIRGKEMFPIDKTNVVGIGVANGNA